MKPALISYLVIVFTSACTFNFELTSQRTALENQVMGVYQELDDEVLLLSTVRAVRESASENQGAKATVIFHRRNQEFNRDDIEELKEKGLIGERWDGLLEQLGKNIARQKEHIDDPLSSLLIKEENSDRKIIWGYVLTKIPEGSAISLSQIGEAYGKAQWEKLGHGGWFKNQKGVWQQKL